MTKLTRVGQIKKGDNIEVTSSFVKALYEVEDVLNQGTDKEEILLDKENNLYFVVSLYLEGDSWAKNVKILKVEKTNEFIDGCVHCKGFGCNYCEDETLIRYEKESKITNGECQ